MRVYLSAILQNFPVRARPGPTRTFVPAAHFRTPPRKIYVYALCAQIFLKEFMGLPIF